MKRRCGVVPSELAGANQTERGLNLRKVGDEFRADLHAPSEVNGLADLRIHHIGLHAVEVIAACLEELQAKAADGDAIALRFA